ncbi:MAG: AAA family ATPase [Candidatus Moranbacteria bacterium]|nr:AAA family ATPase [Candidatus Moranbacteria bacterium]
MKIEKIELQNVKSFLEFTEIIFKDNINIFVGPNAGGKSNLFEIIHALISWILFQEEIQIQFKNQSPGGSVISNKLFTVQRQDYGSKYTSILEKFRGREQEGQRIKIVISVLDQDIKNLQDIINNRDNLDEFIEKEIDHDNPGQKFDYNALKLLIYSKNDFSSLINKSFSIEYSEGRATIKPDNNFTADDLEIFKTFKEIIKNYKVLESYVKLYNLEKDEKIDFNSNFLYIPPLRATSSITYDEPVVSLAQRGLDSMQLSQKNVTQEYTSSSDYDRAKIKLFNNHLYGKENLNEYFKELMKKFLDLDIDIKFKGKHQNNYQLEISRPDNKNIKLSSGEKEIFNFICSIFSYDIKNGIILFDEPELHLHPQMQKRLLRIIEEISEENKIQFFIVTHSPSFVNKDSIENVFRIYRNEKSGGSRTYYPCKKLEANDKDLVQIVNSLNNERIFFSDKVILVEGVVDQIIYGKILEIIKKEKENNEIIEILDVGGKNSFKRFSDFISSWKIKTYIVGDLDSLTEFKKVSLAVDCKKVTDNLKEKGSKDGEYLRKLLKNIFKKNLDLEQKSECEQKFENAINYILSRSSTIKAENKEEFISEITSLKKDQIFILSEGELETYFPPITHFSIESAIKKMQELERDTNQIPKEIRGILENIVNQ